MRDLECANDLIESRAALDRKWQEEGYWFFRNVLDMDAVSMLRGRFVQILRKYSLIAPDDESLTYTGASLAGFPMRMDPLVEAQCWRDFVTHPAIDAFFGSILGADPFWIPITEYRATPPGDSQADRIVNIHQDSFYNQGIPFRICWIPLSPIDDFVGGIALAPGLHRGPLLHDLASPPKFKVPRHAIADDAWARADYQPGDLLMFDLHMPHSGLTNCSNRFRLSMDIRVQRADGHLPVIGTLVEARPDRLIVEAEGRRTCIALNEGSYIRDDRGQRLALQDYARQLAAGTQIIVAQQAGVATVVRPVH